MSTGPSSSGEVLGLGYTSPIMLLHQILEPLSQGSGLESLRKAGGAKTNLQIPVSCATVASKTSHCSPVLPPLSK